MPTAYTDTGPRADTSCTVSLAADLGALNSQSLQMAERALLSPDELKNLPKGNFIVMKTGVHPMRTKLQLYFKWGIKFEEPYQVPERAQREVYSAGRRSC